MNKLYVDQCCRFTLPSANNILQIESVACNMAANGAHSIKYTHISGETMHFPLWVVPLWAKILLYQKDHQIPQLKADNWLKELQWGKWDADFLDAAQSVYMYLESLPWSMVGFGYQIQSNHYFQAPYSEVTEATKSYLTQMRADNAQISLVTACNNAPKGS